MDHVLYILLGTGTLLSVVLLFRILTVPEALSRPKTSPIPVGTELNRTVDYVELNVVPRPRDITDYKASRAGYSAPQANEFVEFEHVDSFASTATFERTTFDRSPFDGASLEVAELESAELEGESAPEVASEKKSARQRDKETGLMDDTKALLAQMAAIEDHSEETLKALHYEADPFHLNHPDTDDKKDALTTIHSVNSTDSDSTSMVVVQLSDDNMHRLEELAKARGMTLEEYMVIAARHEAGEKDA
ncbi:MAG: hypothetical protein ACPGYX_10190 [Oceanobacter sp.]